MNVHHGLDNLPAFKNAVLTIGSFDGVHEGHRSIIDQICQLAEQKRGESILLTFDPHPRHVLDPQDKSLFLLNTLQEKLRLLQNTGIDHVVVVPFTFEFSQLTKEEYLQKVIIENFDPAAIVIGYDHRFGMNRQGDVHFLREKANHYGYHVVEISEAKVHRSKVSSTEVRTALRNKEVIKANQLLGYAYHLTGNVVQGLKLGSKLGYPTANISIQDKHKLIPDEGVYAVKIRIDGKWYQGMMYIGQRPTLKKKYGRTIEVNIFDFHGDIYGEEVKVELKAYIRGDLKFDDLEMLKRQISDDERVVKRLFHRMDDDSSKLTKCAIVILNYNGRQHLETYLPSVIAKSKGSEIIIADNQSTDDSLAFLSEHYPDIQLIVLDKNYGFAGGYNEALKQIKAKYYILLNSDIEPGEGFPGTLIEMLDSDPEISAVQPKVRSWKNKSSFEYAGAAGGYMDLLGYPLCRGRVLETTEEDEGQYDTVEEVFWATGCAMAVRSNLFHKLGGFDDWYFAHQEEIDLCWRMKRAGYKVMVEPKATVYHLGGGTLDYLSTKKTYLNFKNSLANIFKNQPIVLALPLVLIRLILDGAASVYFLSKGQSSHVLAVLKSHLHFYLGLPKLIQKKLYFNQLVNRTRCGPSRTKFGSLHLSVVFEYYLRGKKTFKDLIS